MSCSCVIMVCNFFYKIQKKIREIELYSCILRFFLSPLAYKNTYIYINWKKLVKSKFFPGTLLTSPTVHLAFDETYYLERACSNICQSLSAVGGSTDRLKTMPTNLVEDCAKFFTPEKLDLYARRHFYAYWNLYLKQEPEVFS